MRRSAVVVPVLLLTACAGGGDPSPGDAARRACAQIASLVTAPSMQTSYVSRYADAAAMAEAARDADPAWTELATALGVARDAAQDVVDAARSAGTTGSQQRAANEAYRSAQAAARSACASP